MKPATPNPLTVAAHSAFRVIEIVFGAMTLPKTGSCSYQFNRTWNDYGLRHEVRSHDRSRRPSFASDSPDLIG
jgi:hypothetical protein